MKTRNPIKKYVMDTTLSWEERYKQLDAHHQEERKFFVFTIETMENTIEELITEVKTLENDIELMKDEWL